MFTPEHYAARASELEAAAELVSDKNVRATYLELARSFREMADVRRESGQRLVGDNS